MQENPEEIIRKQVTSPESLWRAGMFGAVLFFILMGSVLSARLSSLGTNAAAVNHTNRVIHNLDSIFRTLLDIESGQRGFIITGEQTFLDPLADGQKELPQLFSDIENLIADNSVQFERLAKLKELASARMEEVKGVLRLWRDVSHDEAVARIRAGYGKSTMQDIRAIINDMQETEQVLLDKRNSDFKASQFTTRVVTYTGVAIILIITFLTLYFVRVFRKNELSLAATSENLNTTAEALRKSEGEFRALANSVPQFVWIANTSGYLTYFNDRWFNYSGMESTGDTGSKWMDYVHPEDREKTKILWAHSISTGEPYEIQYRLRNEQGIYRWFMGRAVPIFNEKESITQWFGTCTDIHDSKVLEEERDFILASERSARDEVEKANRVKDEFVATLSHELRGPLNAILGWVQIMASKKNDQQILLRGIDVITRNTQLQSQLISDLFDFHRVQAGKLTINFGRIHLSDLVNSCADSVVPSCKEKNITVIRNIKCEVCDIPGDGNRLSQVLMNILNNCVKFTPENQTITLTLDSDDHVATIDITDTGIGIDAESLPHIFDRYNQGIEKSEKKGSGLGLGLSIAKSFVLLHHGTITARSEGIGKGSTFSVSIPCLQPGDTDESPEANVVKNETPSPLSGLKILLVEDQEDAIEALERILSEKGATILTASSGDHALRILEEHKPDIMISDISMPGMDGYSLMTRARTLHPSLASIALTAFSRKEDRERASVVGFSDHITKPVDIAMLIASILRIKNPLV